MSPIERILPKVGSRFASLDLAGHIPIAPLHTKRRMVAATDRGIVSIKNAAIVPLVLRRLHVFWASPSGLRARNMYLRPRLGLGVG